MTHSFIVKICHCKQIKSTDNVLIIHQGQTIKLLSLVIVTIIKLFLVKFMIQLSEERGRDFFPHKYGVDLNLSIA